MTSPANLIPCPIRDADGRPCLTFPFEAAVDLMEHLGANACVFEITAPRIVAAFEAPAPTYGTAAPAPRTPAPATPAAVLTAADVDALCVSLGRKFDAADMTPALVTFAAAWLANYTGSFEFLTDLQRKARKLTAGQAKGVLNCYRADLNRAARAAAPAATTATATPAEAPLVPVPGMIYATAAGELVKAVQAKAGHFYGKTHDGAGWDFAPGAWQRVTRVATAEECAAFGHEHDRCVFCSRSLTDDRSVIAGYGEICSDKFGLPWG